MKRTRLLPFAGACLAVLAMTTFATAMDTEKVVASFLKHIDSIKSVDAETKSSIKKSIEQDMSSDSLTDGLIKIYPDYSKAVASSDDENLDEAIKLLSPLADSEDKFLAADANFYLARTLMNSERFEEAMPLLDQLMGKLKSHSAHQGSAQYFKGVAQAGLLKNQEAIDSFIDFYNQNPDAPERLRVSAYRQVQQLRSIKEGKLDDVYQRMDYSRRRLTQIETGEKTQEEQDKIIGMLTKMIKEEQKKEAASSCKKGGT